MFPDSNTTSDSFTPSLNRLIVISGVATPAGVPTHVFVPLTLSFSCLTVFVKFVPF